MGVPSTVLLASAALGGAPSASQGSVLPHKQASKAQGEPHLRDSEAMGLGMGRSFAECFAAGPWHSWERKEVTALREPDRRHQVGTLPPRTATSL